MVLQHMNVHLGFQKLSYYTIGTLQQASHNFLPTNKNVYNVNGPCENV